MYVASSKVSSSEVEKHLCRVCSKPFLTISSRNKHERVNRKCSEVSIVEVGAADHGRDEGEGVSVEFSVNNIRQQCNFCHHKFTTVFTIRRSRSIRRRMRLRLWSAGTLTLLNLSLSRGSRA